VVDTVSRIRPSQYCTADCGRNDLRKHSFSNAHTHVQKQKVGRDKAAVEVITTKSPLQWVHYMEFGQCDTASNRRHHDALCSSDDKGSLRLQPDRDMQAAPRVTKQCWRMWRSLWLSAKTWPWLWPRGATYQLRGHLNTSATPGLIIPGRKRL
jgi:hypothetical protein